MEEQSPARIRPWQINVVIALLALIVVVSVAHAWKSRQAPAVQWEYRIHAIKDDSLKEDLYTLGAEGWELVFARRATVGEFDLAANPKPEMRYEMIFRRPAR